MNETIFCKGGSQYTTKLIDELVKNGTRMATVQGDWEIDEAIRIPGDFTLVLDDCHLRMADGCFSNLFVNEHHNIEIENITGFVEDDSVAINACGGDLVGTFSVDGLSPHIYSITVKNVRTASLCNNVRLLNQGEAKMHDILIDGAEQICVAFKDRHG